MNEVFIKSYHGHDFEFVRLLYPLRYHLFIRNENANPTCFVVTKQQDGDWKIQDHHELPHWVKNYAHDINAVLEENENKVLA